MSIEHDMMVERLAREMLKLHDEIRDLRIATTAAFNVHPDTLKRQEQHVSMGQKYPEEDAQFEERVHLHVHGDEMTTECYCCHQGQPCPCCALHWGADRVAHPKHYTNHPSGVETIEIARSMGFDIGNAVKYLTRAGLKGDAREDLQKALWYAQDAYEHRYTDRNLKARTRWLDGENNPLLREAMRQLILADEVNNPALLSTALRAAAFAINKLLEHK